MPTDPRLENLRLLASIDASLKALVAATAQRNAPDADDAICNGKYGDPIVKAKDPRDWTGEPMNGRKFSECPPDYLDLLAERSDYFASKEADEKKQKYAILDARRARAWAARLRAGWTAPATPARDTEDVF